MAILYKLQKLEKEKWVDETYSDGTLFLFRKQEAEELIKINKEVHNITLRYIEEINDPKLHHTPFGQGIHIGEDNLGISTWKCEQRKGSTCRYNIKDDPACDGCIYCGEPQERF